MANLNELTKVRQHLLALKEIAYFAASDVPLAVFFRHVAQQVARGIEIDHVKIVRYRAQSDDLLIIAGVGWRDGVVGHVGFPSAMSSPPGRSFQTAMPVSIPDFDRAGEYVLSPTLRAHGIVALLNVPIMIDGAVWGVLEVDSTVPRDFSIDTQDFLIAAAAIVAAAVARENVALAHARSLETAALEGRRNEMLLQEMQHRVKNNFQLVLSMVSNLRSRMDADVFDKLSDNIIAMSLAHAQLNPGQTGEAVPLPTYLRALGMRLQHLADGVTIEVHVDEHSIAVERAVALGLIVNELVTNSVKHAFAGKPGTIVILLRAQDGDLCLTVSDNGVGRPEAASSGTGLRLVAALTRQLRGRTELRRGTSGTTTCVVFPRR